MNNVRLTPMAIHAGILAASLFLSMASTSFGELVAPAPVNTNAAQAESSYLVSGLPTDGRTLFVRLWYRVGGFWEFTDEPFTAVTLVAPGLTDPVLYSTLDSSEVMFRWSANDQSVSKWWMYIGSTPGARDVYNSSDLGLNVVHMVSGLPTDGRTLYIRLWYQVGGFWQFVDQQVIAATLAAPMVMSPVAGSTLGDANVTFQWTANEQPVTNWWFFIGSSTGGRDIYNSGDLGTNLSQRVTALPNDGRTLHVRLWYRSGEYGGLSMFSTRLRMNNV